MSTTAKANTGTKVLTVEDINAAYGDDAESLLEGPDFDALIDQIRVTNQVRKAARS
jgi:hypothetical protein